MIKKNFLWAIDWLKSRNQRFVDKNGVTAWSKETDRIIEAMVEYFNDREKINEGIRETNRAFNKLVFILELYGVPYKKLFHCPVEFLEFENNNLKMEGASRGQLKIQLIQILSDYNRHQVIIESLIQSVTNYLEIENQVVKENILETWPRLAEYFHDPERENLIEIIQDDYYAGRVKA